MNEVSCKALWLLFEVARQRGIDARKYVDGLPVTLEHIANPSKRIDWDIFCSLVERFEGIVGGPAELENVAQVFAQAPSVKGVRSVLGLVTSPRAMYWAVHRWFGHAVFTIVSSTFKDIGPNEIEMELRIPDGFRASPAFMRINAGVFRANPRALDLPDASVEFTPGERVGRYRIRLPLSMTVLARTKRAVMMVFSANAALKELGSQQDEIKQKHFQLDVASRSLEQKKHELEVISVVTGAAHASLDLEAALRAICVQVVGQLGYHHARFSVNASQDGLEVTHTAEYGARQTGDHQVVGPLVFRNIPLGELVASRMQQPSDDERRFLKEVAAACALAINNAIAFQVIRAYRHELEDRVSERTAQLASALEQVKHQQAARQRIFQNISHELRTPLSLISLSTGDIAYREKGLTATSKQRLDQIDDSIQRLLQLFDGMLLLAAGQEGKLRIRPAHTDVAIELRSLVSAWMVAAEKQGIQLSFSGPQRLSIRVDDAGLARAVSNLLSNAIKFTPQGGSVEVRLEEADASNVRIVVQDSGVGMDDEFLGRVFGRFEQGPAPVRAGERGSGIGLAIVKEIAEAHGGTATVKSERGRGSTFTLMLPKEQDLARLAAKGEGSYIPSLQQRAPEIETAAERPAQEASPAGKAAAVTVLVAEDDPVLRQFLVELLSRDYRVVAAPDGLAALRLVKEHQPAILITDIGMPGIDGIELTRRFRQTSADKLAPVILLTAYAVVETRLQGLEAGAVDYVTKPFHPAELLARVKGQLAVRDMAMRLHESQKLAGLGILSAGLAHELRNPANGVVNAIGPLKRMLPKEVFEPGTSTALLFEALSTGAEQIAVLTKQLLGFSRQGELEVREEALSRILDSAEALVEPALGGRRVRRDLKYTDAVRCARGLVVQVLVNLLENAAHASPPGGEIVLSTSVENGFVMFDVKDSGPGVPKELRDRIFDPFFTTKPPGQGTGLGLSISKMIAERHGGTLRLLEGERGGAFRLELPERRVALPKTSPLLESVAVGSRP